MYDTPIPQEEVEATVRTWDKSYAYPPDLITRAAFHSGSRIFLEVTWRLQALAGPAKFALRPGMWRFSCVVAIFKDGDVLSTTNF